MFRILLTSFEPFGGHAANSSHHVGEELARRPPPGVALDWLSLPVVAGECDRLAWERVVQSRPTLVLALGQAAGSERVRVEDRAVNLHDFPIPDNAGRQPRLEWIVPGAPGAYRTTAALERVLPRLRERRLPGGLSFSAGRYVCKHL